MLKQEKYNVQILFKNGIGHKLRKSEINYVSIELDFLGFDYKLLVIGIYLNPQADER